MNIVPLWVALLGSLGVVTAVSAASERGPLKRPLPPETSARVIIGFKADAPTAQRRVLGATTARDVVLQEAQTRADKLAKTAGVPLTAGRMLGARAQVLTAAGVDSATLARRLAAHPELEYAVPDRRRRVLAVPSDPLYAAGPANGQGPNVGQWYLHAPDATIRSAINAPRAWDLVSPDPGLVVAVLDTGVLFDHPDLSGRLLVGYDFIADTVYANDGNGRDNDASDPGDWITAAEDKGPGPLQGCLESDSSWHGTQVSGIIGAAANNGIGMAGVAAGVRILPVRVLGKCGGYDSDIVAGIYWAAGVNQPGQPGSSSPARVLNLSLGGDGDCARPYQDAINAIGAPPRNAVLVAAAGNSTGRAPGQPANCAGVIAVTGLRHAGTKVGYADIGLEVTIAAPAGNCINIEPGTPCLYPILTTSNSGTQSPTAGGSIWTDSYNISVGTSFATPIVAGVTALMLAAEPSLTPADVKRLIQHTARPFPDSGADNGSDPTPVPVCHQPDGRDQLQCYCRVGLCGAGMVDAAAAVLAALPAATQAAAREQLMDVAEQLYPDVFKGHPPTGTWGPFVFRYYPDTGVYLGVVAQGGRGYPLNSVYVLGGPFGLGEPVYGGSLTDYVTPRVLAQGAGR